MAKVTIGQKALEIADREMGKSLGFVWFSRRNTGRREGSANWIFDFVVGLNRQYKVNVKKQDGSVTYKEL